MGAGRRQRDPGRAGEAGMSVAERPRYRIGIDVGGTFTDLVLVSTDTGAVVRRKELTTPEQPEVGIMRGLEDLVRDVPDALTGAEHIIHGTTLVINAVIERTGPPTALLTTRGFRDVLELRRHKRNEVYDIRGDHREPLIPRELRFEVSARLRSDGAELAPVDEDEIAAVAARLAELGVASVAVCYLHSYLRPDHERATRDILARVAPELSVSLSSDVLPELKEFERTSSTAINAYSRPLVSRYLTSLESRLAERGTRGRLLLMHSSGGVLSTETAKAFPVRIIESGPVAGVLAAVHAGRQAGEDDVIAFDMGGTTAKACVVSGGTVPMTNEFEVARMLRLRKGSGLPVGVEAVDLVEIGAGGGSIAAVNERGLLGVGPRSAGAEPGPAGYGRGGTEPTVTDADLVLGFVSADSFRRPGLHPDAGLAERAILARVGEPLGLSLHRAAFGIHDIVNENMAAAISSYLAERGVDRTKRTLVASGGAGPVHAYGLARKLGIGRVIVPYAAGLASALGFMVAPVSYLASRALRVRFDAVSPAEVFATRQELADEVSDALELAAPGREVRLHAEIDACYSGQDYAVPLDLCERPEELTAQWVRQAFDAAYSRQYGYTYDDVPLDLVRVRVRGEAVDRGVPWSGTAAATVAGTATTGTRPAYDLATNEWAEFAVVVGDLLPEGTTVPGPCIIEQAETSVVAGSDATVVRLAGGHFLIEIS
ncbi:MAG: hydantoinase/oxoprolinase family protein [Micromonosporaceae bacterium]|nr:hydantoinase/oxoprolinase family protein [Micromonosporaceae bacterium]